MSLSRWFRDYLYIPLGGNRNGTAQTYRNLVIVFLATGIWHGAAWTFVLWGAYHGAWLIIERVTGLARSQRYVAVRRAATFVIVIFGWVLFRAADLPEFGRMAGAMLVPDGLREPMLGLHPDIAITLGWYHALLLVLVVASAFLPGGWVTGRAIDGVDGGSRLRHLSTRGLALVAAPYAAVVVVAGTFSPFLYFQF